MTPSLSLHSTGSCPYCVRVQRTIKKLKLDVEIKDVFQCEEYRTELTENGGVYQVPCLQIEHAKGQVQWMYESKDIESYLQERFSG